MSRRLSYMAKYSLTATAIAALYFVSGKFGLALAFVHANATAVWPPTGIALAALLACGYRFWPALMVGAFLVNWTTQGTVATSIGIATGNTLEAIIGTYLVTRYCKGRACFNRTFDTLKFAILASLPGPTVSATIGVTSLFLGGFAEWHSSGTIWITWFLGDVGGALVVAPVLLLLAALRSDHYTRRQILEGILLLAVIMAVGTTVFCGALPLGTIGKPLGFVCLPICVWAAFRFESLGAAIAGALLTGFATWGTLNGQGPFATGFTNESLLYLQAFMATVTVTSLVVAAEVNERRGKEDELKQAEEQSRTVVESALDGIITINDFGNIIEWNPSATKIFGWSREEALGNTVAELIIPEKLRQAHLKGLEHFIVSGEGPILNRLLQMLALRKDGTEFPVELTVLPMKRLNARWQFCAFLRDISERKAYEQEIENSNRLLERRVQERTAQLATLAKDLESFSYTVSHDLRAPIRHIEGFLSIFREESAGTFGPKGEECLNHIADSARKMDKLIEDLLKFSRMGQAALEKSAIRLNLLIEDIRPILIGSYPGRQVLWKIEKLPDLFGDPSMLRQLFINLISNSLKFTASRETTIIEIGSKDVNGRKVVFVRDNGIGFDMKFANRIFDAFQRLHKESDFEGSGVGLALVKRIVERHGGRIWAESKVGEGATFYVALPKSIEEEG